MSSQILQRERSTKLLKELPEPKNVFQFFLRCAEIPRKSSELEALTVFLENFADERGLYHKRDSAGNLVIRKDGAQGYENVASVCMQAHMDMVCSSTGDFDFLNSPIDCVYEKESDLLKATGTTLGADNGIGVAAMLALLDENLDIGPIECLFTYDEETTMSGAEFIDPSLLISNSMINLDSEEDNAICLGCAGGFETYLDLHYEPVSLDETFVLYDISLSGFMGGHTGIDINKGRGNAVKSMARILSETGVRVVSYTGGTAPNTIPRSCVAIVAIPADSLNESLSEMDTRFETITEEFKAIESEIKFAKQESTQSVTKSLSESDSQKLFDLIYMCPNGPLRMDPHIEGAVSTSTSLSAILTDENKIRLHNFTRSDSESASREARLSFESLARLSNIQISDAFNPFPGWTPNPNTKLMKNLLATYEKLAIYDKPPHVYSIHAGLECGLIMGKYPTMEIVSIGPLITNAHTPDEALHVSTVEPFYNILVETLKSLRN